MKLDPNRPRQYEVVALNADGTREILEIISCHLKLVTEDAAVFEILVVGDSVPQGGTT